MSRFGMRTWRYLAMVWIGAIALELVVLEMAKRTNNSWVLLLGVALLMLPIIATERTFNWLGRAPRKRWKRHDVEAAAALHPAAVQGWSWQRHQPAEPRRLQPGARSAQGVREANRSRCVPRPPPSGSGARARVTRHRVRHALEPVARVLDHRHLHAEAHAQHRARRSEPANDLQRHAGALRTARAGRPARNATHPFRTRARFFVFRDAFAEPARQSVVRHLERDDVRQFVPERRGPVEEARRTRPRCARPRSAATCPSSRTTTARSRGST